MRKPRLNPVGPIQTEVRERLEDQKKQLRLMIEGGAPTHALEDTLAEIFQFLQRTEKR
jgi:hypothetical protein